MAETPDEAGKGVLQAQPDPNANVIQEEGGEMPIIRRVARRSADRSHFFRKRRIVVATDRGQVLFETQYSYADFCLGIIDEVLARPRFRRYWEPTDQALSAEIAKTAELISKAIETASDRLGAVDEALGVGAFNDHCRQFEAPLRARWSKPLLDVFSSYDRLVVQMYSIYQEGVVTGGERDELLDRMEKAVRKLCAGIASFRDRLMFEVRARQSGADPSARQDAPKDGPAVGKTEAAAAGPAPSEQPAGRLEAAG